MCQVLNSIDDIYPQPLRTIPSYPKKLYYFGNASSDIFSNCLSVVGSRNMTPYGEKVINYFLEALSNAPITIVSGFTRGVDICTHECALKYGMRTIAVVPFGLEYSLSLEQKKLISKISEKGGLVLTEYVGDFAPKVWSFHRRNRIVAGLSRATLVIEARKNSGSLITASYCIKFGRKLLTVPCSIFSTYSEGLSQLISLGANIVIDPYKINEICSLNIQCPQNTKINSLESFEEEQIVNLLSSEAMTLDELSKNLTLPIEKLTYKITLMSLKGLIREEGGLLYLE